jgi:hypothetical protein
MLIKKELEERLKDMELFAKTIGIEPFDLYLLGGSASILGNYSDRGTRDFDFIDLNYPSKYGRVFRLLGTFDFLEYESTILAPSYKDRANKLENYEYINIYILAPEDLIVSKIIRLSEKDVGDIENLLKQSDLGVIYEIIDEVLKREDLIESKKEGFLNKLKVFREVFDV